MHVTLFLLIQAHDSKQFLSRMKCFDIGAIIALQCGDLTEHLMQTSAQIDLKGDLSLCPLALLLDE